MTKREAAIVTAYTGILIGEFQDALEYFQEITGRMIFTHMLADESFLKEIKDKSSNDFMQIMVA